MRKALISVLLVFAAGLVLVEFQQASRLRREVQTLHEQQVSLSEQVQSLRTERDDAVNRLAAIRVETERLKVDQAALFKLRGEMTLLRQQTNESGRLASELDQLRRLQKQGAARSFIPSQGDLSALESCRLNFRQINGAVDQFALEKKQIQGEKVYPGDILRRPWDRLQILTAAQTHLLRCSLGQRPLRASSRVRASHLHLWRSPSFVAYPTVSSVLPYLVKKELPHCPAGGTYSLRGVGNDATCSMEGHTL